MHMLAYNLIRKVMAIAAKETGVAPHQFSFKGALQKVNPVNDLERTLSAIQV